MSITEAYLDEAPSATARLKRMKEIETACAEEVRTRWQPQLEAAVRSLLGSRPDGERWLTFKFDESVKSPVLLFAYPGEL